MPLDARKIARIKTLQARTMAGRTRPISLHQSDGSTITVSGIFRTSGDQISDVSHPATFNPVDSINAIAEFRQVDVTLAQLQACLYITVTTPLGSEAVGAYYIIDSIVGRGMPQGGDRWFISLDARARFITLTRSNGSTVNVIGVLVNLGDTATQQIKPTGYDPIQGQHALAEFKSNAVALPVLQDTVTLALTSPGTGSDLLASSWIIDALSVKSTPAAGDRYLCQLDGRTRALTLITTGGTINTTGIFHVMGDQAGTQHLTSSPSDPLNQTHAFAEISTKAVTFAAIKSTITISPASPVGPDALNPTNQYIPINVTVRNLVGAGDRYVISLDARGRNIALTLKASDNTTSTLTILGVIRAISDFDPAFNRASPINTVHGSDAVMIIQVNSITLAQLRSCIAVAISSPLDDDTIASRYIPTSIGIKDIPIAGDRYLVTLERQR